VMATVVVGVLVALSLMANLPKAVTAPLAQLTKAVENLSIGQLDKKIDVGQVTEFAGLAVALERLRIGQQALVARMRRNA
jgi:methyl-accepting chemotaxis protein